MHVSRCGALILCLSLLPSALRADASVANVSGIASDGSPLGAELSAEFIPTGGDFDQGQGLGLLRITLNNRSGLVPFADPRRGNPVATDVFFNVPRNAHLFLMSVTVPASGVICQLGTASYLIPGQIGVLAAPLDVTSLYELRVNAAAGPLGTFTHALSSIGGVRGGAVDARLFEGLARLGDIYSPLVFGGALEFELFVSGLDRSADSASDFLAECALNSRGGVPGAVAVRYQGVGIGGQDSATLSNPCVTTPVVPSTWGAVKSLYR